MDIYTFNISEIGLTPLSSKVRYSKAISIRNRKILLQNNERFTDWCIGVLQKHAGRELQENEQWNALGVFMNKENIDFIHECLSPMFFLSYAPTEDDTLKDTEYGITEAITKREE